MRNADNSVIHETDLRIVAKAQSSAAQVRDMLFAFKVVKHLISNARFIRGDWIMDRAVVIDAGSHPGGVGPMTVAPLMAQAVMAAKTMKRDPARQNKHRRSQCGKQSPCFCSPPSPFCSRCSASSAASPKNFRRTSGT
ncbi:hypothetical protein [Rhodoblastus sphagnicola]|uniref:hypothetical protein n=1 Tax=Rhodoblastus sphagnicola TaxID=333368 RepID=UPI0013049A2F